MDNEQLIYFVQKAQQGDEEALSELFNAFYSELYYFALKNVKSEDVAEDIVQEVFLNIFKDIKALNSLPLFFVGLKLLHTINVLNFLKRKKRCLLNPMMRDTLCSTLLWKRMLI